MHALLLFFHVVVGRLEKMFSYDSGKGYLDGDVLVLDDGLAEHVGQPMQHHHDSLDQDGH